MTFTLTTHVAAYALLIGYGGEVAHFAQYALLAIPIHALTDRFGPTAAWVLIAGVLILGITPGRFLDAISSALEKVDRPTAAAIENPAATPPEPLVEPSPTPGN